MKTKEYLLMVAKRELSRKQLDKFTTASLIQSANVSRSTVYYQFKNGINDVYKETFQNNLLKPIIEDADDWKDALDIGINQIHENNIMYDNLYHLAAINSRKKYLNARVKHLVNTVLQKELDKREITSPHLDFMIGGIIYQINLWVETEFEEHPESLIHRLIKARDMIYLD